MRKGRPLRKYGTIILNYTVTVHAGTKIEAVAAFHNKGVLVTVPMIFEMENEAGIPLRRGGPGVKKKKEMGKAENKS